MRTPVKPRRSKNKLAAAAAQATNELLGIPTSARKDTSAASLHEQKPLEAFALQLTKNVRPKRRQPGQHKRPAALARITDLFTASGRQYAQAAAIPHSVQPHTSALSALLAGQGKIGDAAQADLNVDYGQWDLQQDWDMQEPQEDDRARHSRRRTAQSKTWIDHVLPRLIEPVLRLRHGLGVPVNDLRACLCPRSSFLDIILASWDELETVNIRVCQCRPAAEQLLAVGFFPCAPVRPSIAFSVRLLDFISIHSLHVAPNATAFADTLVHFWAKLGKAVGRGDVRKRLAATVHWWQVLENRVDSTVRQTLQDSARHSPASFDPDDNALPTFTVGSPDASPSKQARVEQTATMPQPSVVQPTTEPRDRPSEHLRQVCPLCFGGERPELALSGAHCIVCLDANFQQKRRKSHDRDPEMKFDGSFFLSPEDLLTMERQVEEKRATRQTHPKRGKAARLPEDVLDQCEESFTAAQEKVAKASRNYYAETGLMAVLCRHDRVLFVANMTSVGEKQYNALALIRRLLDELPLSWNVGVLYDIACQLSRSIDKYDLIGASANRLSWAVSVFHAYGHQWACQVLFHPRKCDGFGRSDGEGCERFWSAIRKLIPVLRVTGYHRRMFMLDRQISYQHDEGLQRLGSFVLRRYDQARITLEDAISTLEKLQLDEEDLAVEWERQLESQLEQAPRQSKHTGDKMIEDILLELSRLDESKQALQRRRQAFRKLATLKTPEEIEVETQDIATEQQALKSWTLRIKDKMRALGETNQRRLDSLKGDTYLRLRINARSLREKIRKAVVKHKFERSRLERHYRGQIQQNKDHEQAKDAVHRRERSLSDTIKRFNSIVQEMEVLIAAGKAPRRAAKPRRLDPRRLFKLDVDDDIWQPDPGLGPQGEGELPRWQTDRNVQDGITQMLEARRCREEMERLSQEARAMSQWLMETARTLNTAFAAANSAEGLKAELEARLSRHSKLAAIWLQHLSLVQPLGVDQIAVVSAALNNYTAAQLSLSRKIGVSLLNSDSTNNTATDQDQLSESDDASSMISSAGDVDDDFDSVVSDVREEWEEQAVDEAEWKSSPALGAKHETLSISSDGSDEAVPPPSMLRRATPHEPGRRCGRFSCLGEDVERVASRSRWLTGQSLAVFAESAFLQSDSSDVGHVDSEVLWHVRRYIAACHEGRHDTATDHCQAALARLEPVLKPPQARKWLVTTHIEVPQHWTLLQIDWQQHKVSFFDSFSMRNGYVAEIRALVFTLLQWCTEIVPAAASTGPWTWVDEEREARQSNAYDCGAFVAADIVSLLHSDSPSMKTEEDMRAWRIEMASQLCSLEPS